MLPIQSRSPIHFRPVFVLRYDSDSRVRPQHYHYYDYDYYQDDATAREMGAMFIVTIKLAYYIKHTVQNIFPALRPRMSLIFCH